ncbi:hypothetical protein D3C72_2124450 [compost metagenome]
MVVAVVAGDFSHEASSGADPEALAFCIEHACALSRILKKEQRPVTALHSVPGISRTRLQLMSHCKEAEQRQPLRLIEAEPVDPVAVVVFHFIPPDICPWLVKKLP